VIPTPKRIPVARAQHLWSIGALLLGVAVVSRALAGHSAVLDDALTIGLINLIMVIGLYVFVGNSGIVSFGHVGFMAVGAYVCGLFTIPKIAQPIIIPNAPGIFLHTHLSTASAIIAGGIAAAIVALLVSVPLMRLSGIAASIGTLSLLVIVNTFFEQWEPGTSGGGNLTQIPTDISVNAAMIWTLLALLAAFAYERSRFGLRLRATREDELAARGVGINARRERRIAFTLSGMMFGVAGALYAHALGSISAEDFYLPVTFITLAMLVVGGQLSLAGAVAGTLLLSVVSFVLTQWQNDNAVMGIAIQIPAGVEDLVIAVVLIAVLLLRPNGITNGREIPLPTFVRRRLTTDLVPSTIDAEASRAADSDKLTAPS